MQNFLSSFKGRKAPLSPRQEWQISFPNTNSLTVIELFQSQGCSSCPPANHNVLKLVDDPHVLVLTYDVTYWDHLGWRDTFGRSEFDRRQWAYAYALQRKNVFTPQVCQRRKAISMHPRANRHQVIANGQVSGVGGTTRDLQSLVQKARALDESSLVEIQHDFHTKAVHISGPADQSGIVNLVQYDPTWVEISIARGENGGSTLPHANVVRRIMSLGKWTGGKQEFSLPATEDTGLRTAVLVQTSEAGSILGAARI